MKITEVSYRAKCETYSSYSHQEIGLTAKLEPDEDYQETLNELKEIVHGCLADKQQYFDFQQRITFIQNRLEEMQKAYQTARADWDKLTQFLNSQGLKQDFPNFPSLEFKQPSMLPPFGDDY